MRILNGLDKEMRDSLLIIAVMNAPSIFKKDQYDLSKQYEAKLHKEELVSSILLEKRSTLSACRAFPGYTGIHVQVRRNIAF